MFESNGNCQYREAYEFGSDRIILNCCKNPDAFPEITDFYQVRSSQDLSYPFDGLISQMMEGRHKVTNGKGKIPIIAIPFQKPVDYCSRCCYNPKISL